MNKRVVIIGAGVAGLSAGIYAAMNGFDTEIIEMHYVAGGQCTAWDRKKFRFDYCLHWLVGTSHGAFHKIWKETNVINNKTEVVDHEIHSRIFDKDRNEFIIYADLDRWEKYLIEFAPEDTLSIRKMCADMRKTGALESFEAPPELRDIRDYIQSGIRMLPLLRLMGKYGKMSCVEYFDRLHLKNSRLRSFLYGMYGYSSFSALVFVFMLGWFNQKNAGYIKGGSYPLAQRMVEKFEKLGGVISYKKKVDKIVVSDNLVAGVVLTDGKIIPADYVISAADGYTTIYKMLDGKYTSKAFNDAYQNWELFTPIVQVSFGIGKQIPANEPIVMNIADGIQIGRTKLANGYSIMNYDFDSTMAPRGKSTIILRYESPWHLWENLEGEEYQYEKQQILKGATACLEMEYPGISAFIEVTDVATPITNVFYTGVRNGAYEGFLPTKDNMMKTLKMRLPRLRNFYMAGQWLFPGGGLPPAAQTGKWAVQLICKKERQRFVVDAREYNDEN